MEEESKIKTLTLYACIWMMVLFFTYSESTTVWAQSSQNSKETVIPPRPPVPVINLKPIKKITPKKTTNPEDVVVDSQRTTTNVSMFGKPMHLSCNRSLRNMKTNKVECFGNVYLRRPSELLTSDYAILDLNTNDMHAEGNVVYFTGSTVIYGAKMDFNFDTETGIIDDGRIETDKYELLGEHIDRISDEEFSIQDGEYTTCRDCPASWRLAAKHVDFKVEGYAKLAHVFVKVNDAPTLYFPYAIIPVKTQRQTGLLFPRFGTSELDGFTYIQPFYWATSRSTDFTFGYGRYSKRGRKIEGEFRYSLAPRSHGELKTFFLKDKTFKVDEKYQNRWAFDYSHNLELPWKIEQKIHWVDAGDRDYARFFTGDIPGYGEPALVSDVGFSRAGRDASVWLNGKRIRNNLTSEVVGFDSNTVQLVPSVSVATVDHRISEDFPLHWGLNANYSRFWRTAGDYDRIDSSGNTFTNDLFLPGITPLRRTNRYTIVPEMYYTTRAWDVIEVIPSAQYKTFIYTFDSAEAPLLQRNYLVTQTEFATTFEKVYSSNVKHKFRPSLIYSLIPVVNEDRNHAFIKQLSTSGYQFDESDIVPITNEHQIYSVPLGNSLTYQFGNKFILKSDEAPYRYTKSVDILSGQSINFYEYKKSPKDRQPLSRFFTLVSISTLRISSNLEYYYYPYQKASTYNLGMTYIFSKYQRRLLQYERNIGVGYSYNQITTHTNSISASSKFSINDYFQLVGGANYTFPMFKDSPYYIPDKVISANLGLTYQSPSQCYRIMLLATRVYEQGMSYTFNVPINLSGSGFTSLTEGSTYSGQGGT